MLFIINKFKRCLTWDADAADLDLRIRKRTGNRPLSRAAVPFSIIFIHSSTIYLYDMFFILSLVIKKITTN
jgi:hypothetical protein